MSGAEESKPIFTPPVKIEELYASSVGGTFASINSPTAGARFEKELPKGSAPFQLYSLATPNGQKVGILLEELGIEYDAHGEMVVTTLKSYIFFNYSF
jgi:GST-like protein